MKRWVFTFACIAFAVCAFFAIKEYRATAVDITISLDRTELTVGSDADFGIHAMAKGKYMQSAFVLEPVVQGTVDRNTVGTYQLTIYASYKRAERMETFFITIKDDVAPEITLLTKEGSFTLPDAEYEEEGYTASDNYDGDITDRVERVVEYDKVTYSVTDAAGNTTTVVRKVEHSDPIAPNITLVGENEITIERRRGEYVEQGANAMDNCDGDLSDRITVEGSVDNLTTGDYTITYSAADAAGNVATASRIVHVVEPERPFGDETEAKGKVIYLTFDDGPSIYTKSLLDTLDKYGVKATFFVCNTGSASLIKEIYERGHTIGIHCTTHDYSRIYKSADAYIEDFQKMQDIVYEMTGTKPILFRFPGGSSNTVSRRYCKGVITEIAQRMTEMGYYYFDWNVLSGDSSGDPISTEQVYKNVINAVSNRNVSVVLQHDIKGFSVAAVESIIKWGLANGYTFMPLDETSYSAHQKIAN